ncbi:MAG: HEPN domain-containing protein, partial [Armatimonadota bacterium]|nr:HEPN domain-containing protein [Armatimonadota bacterium]
AGSSMPHDPELVAETRGWPVRARADLAGARVDLSVEPPLTKDATFHAQQAAEKAMKAYLNPRPSRGELPLLAHPDPLPGAGQRGAHLRCSMA